MKLILASKSPRRYEILKNLGYEFTVKTADIDENSDITSPRELVMDLAYKKALSVAKQCDNQCVVIGCDTVVAIGDKILGKPENEQDARKMLSLLSGNVHSVYSGLCVVKGEKVLIDYCKTDVYFDKLTSDDIDWYINQNEWVDKAGSYGIQGKAGIFVKKIDGDYFNVVGLPVNILYNLLKNF